MSPPVLPAKRTSDANQTTNVTLNQLVIVFQKFPGAHGDSKRRGIAHVPCKLTIDDVVVPNVTKTDDDGAVTFPAPHQGAKIVLSIFGTEYAVTPVTIEAPVKDEARSRKAVEARLTMLGYDLGRSGYEDAKEGNVAEHRLDEALATFAADNELDPIGFLEIVHEMQGGERVDAPRTGYKMFGDEDARKQLVVAEQKGVP